MTDSPRDTTGDTDRKGPRREGRQEDHVTPMRMIHPPSPEQIEAIASVLHGKLVEPYNAHEVAALVLDALGAPTGAEEISPDLDAVVTRADRYLDDLALTHERLGPLGMAALRVGIRAALDELDPANAPITSPETGV